MKANPSESAQFPKLLKHIKLNAIAVHDLVTAVRPLKLIDDKDLLDIVYEQAEAAAKPIELLNCNVLSYEYSSKVLAGGLSSFFTVPEEDEVLQHHSSDVNENITVDLRHLYKLNHLVMELANGDWGYWIEVSEDNVNWTRVVDYSKYVCRTVQRVYFKERPVRYIRIHGTNPADDMFEISRLEAYYTEDALDFDPKTGIVIPSDNVALPEKDAIILQGINHGTRHGMIDSAKNDEICTYHEVGINDIILQLAQPYLLDSISLWLTKADLCSCFIEVSTDKINWTRVFTELVTCGYQLIKFVKQPVVFVKLTGCCRSKYFFHFECPAKPEI
uniref:F5/8 type C domain-containing protein n=1 Tax=Panagrellus redivivus TaxID=6233 RepID=A0A7E4ZRC8_PANRE